MQRKVTRQSSCGLLGLPSDLACSHCAPSIYKATLKGVQPKRIKKCSQPWHSKWAKHRELVKVKVHHNVLQFLGDKVVEDGDELVDIHINGEDKQKIPHAPLHSNTISNNKEDLRDKDIIIDVDTNNKVDEVDTLRGKLLNDINDYFTLKETSITKSKLIELQSRAESLFDFDPNCDIISEDMSIINDDKDHNLNIRMQDKIISSRNQKITVSLPYTHAIVYKPDLSLLKTKAAKYDSLIKSLSRDKYTGSNIANRLFGTATSLVSKAGMSGVTLITPMIVGGALANAGIEFDMTKIVQS